MPVVMTLLYISAKYKLTLFVDDLQYEHGDDQSLAAVNKMMPNKVKRRRKIQTESGVRRALWLSWCEFYWCCRWNCVTMIRWWLLLLLSCYWYSFVIKVYKMFVHSCSNSIYLEKVHDYMEQFTDFLCHTGRIQTTVEYVFYLRLLICSTVWTMFITCHL